MVQADIIKEPGTENRTGVGARPGVDSRTTVQTGIGADNRQPTQGSQGAMGPQGTQQGPLSAQARAGQSQQGQNQNEDDSDVAVLKRDLEKLRNDVAQMASSFTQDKSNVVRRFTDELINQSQHLFDTARTRSESMVRSATDQSKQAATQLEGKIQEKPFVSIVLSFLVGLIIAKMMESR